MDIVNLPMSWSIVVKQCVHLQNRICIMETERFLFTQLQNNKTMAISLSEKIRLYRLVQEYALLVLFEPTFMIEKRHEPCGECDHHKQDQWIAVMPLKLWHIVKIHAVDSRDQGQRHKHGGENRYYF